ncbi:MAG: GGDEF domain-containing protein [Spirochaetales bacterium]|nr:GGDEF domain-containing protein [Spirochaetales bacterium]
MRKKVLRGRHVKHHATRFSARYSASSIIILAATVGILGLALMIPQSQIVPEVAAVAGTLVIPEALEHEVVSLVGEWEMVADRTVPPWWFDRSHPTTARVPGAIHGASRLTYRLDITGLDAGERYALLVMDIAQNARVFVNGRTIGTMGTHRSGGELLPSFVPRLFTNVPAGEVLEIVFQIENRVHARGGIWQSVYFGPQDAVIGLVYRLRGLETFAFGAFLVIAMYHLILYLLQQEDKSAFYFAVFTLLIALKTLLSGQQILLHYARPANQVAWIRVAYISVALAIPAFVAYLRELFPRYTPSWILSISSVLAVIQTVAVIVLPFAYVQLSFHAWQGFILLMFLFATFVTGRATYDREAGAAVLLAGLTLLFGFALNDILFDMRLIDTGYYVSAGLFGFLFSQATVLAIRYNLTFQETRRLRICLEEKVVERTEKLQRLAREDELTGLFNRRHATELLHEEIERYWRYGSPISIAVIDIDHFKRINDTYGHQVGDDGGRWRTS